MQKIIFVTYVLAHSWKTSFSDLSDIYPLFLTHLKRKTCKGLKWEKGLIRFLFPFQPWVTWTRQLPPCPLIFQFTTGLATSVSYWSLRGDGMKWNPLPKNTFTVKLQYIKMWNFCIFYKPVAIYIVPHLILDVFRRKGFWTFTRGCCAKISLVQRNYFPKVTTLHEGHESGHWGYCDKDYFNNCKYCSYPGTRCSVKYHTIPTFMRKCLFLSVGTVW
jgi:hypothetical protein